LLACTFAVLFLVTYTMAATPLRIPSRLGMRGLKRRLALQKSESWAAAEPFVHWLGVRMSGLLTDEMHVRLDQMIMRAGDYLGLTPEEYVALCLMGASGCGGFRYLVAITMDYDKPLCVLLGILFGLIVPYGQINEETETRQRQIHKGLPYVIDLIVLAMSAGLDFPGAIRQVVDKSSDPEDALTFELQIIWRRRSRRARCSGAGRPTSP
jgi:tight adherence protein C